MLKMGKHFFILLSLLSVATGLFAQQGNNPFELPSRTIPTEETNPEISAPSSSPAESNPFELNTDSTNETTNPETTTDQNNPFEVGSSPTLTENPPTPAASSPSKTQVDDQNPFEIAVPSFSDPKKTKVKPTKKVDNVTPESLSSKFNLWMTILLISILTVLVNIYKTTLGKVYRSFLNDNFLKMVHRDYGPVTMIPYLILYAFSLTLMGIFLFSVLNYYKISFFSTPIFDLLAAIGSVFVIFLVKHFVLQIIGSIFPISKEIKQYSFTIIIFGIITGLFLLPAILLISYAPPHLTSTIIYGSFILIGLVYLYRILRSLFIALKYISLHKFHFFVYLCTIEIAPLLVLMKVATAT